MNYLKAHIGSIIVIVLIVILSIGSFFVDVDVIKLYIQSAGIWAPIIYILAKISTVVFAPLSGTALYVFSVPLFGFWTSITYSLIGDIIGAIITFYLSRFFGRPIVSYFAGKNNMEYIEKALDVMGTKRGFVTMRLAAVTMPEIASYAAGLTKINFAFFILIHTLVQILPVMFMSSIGLFFVTDLPVWIITSGVILAGIITIASVIFFLWMLKRETNKQSKIQS